jgi:hypothetical protein
MMIVRVRQVHGHVQAQVRVQTTLKITRRSNFPVTSAFRERKTPPQRVSRLSAAIAMVQDDTHTHRNTRLSRSAVDLRDEIRLAADGKVSGTVFTRSKSSNEQSAGSCILPSWWQLFCLLQRGYSFTTLAIQRLTSCQVAPSHLGGSTLLVGSLSPCLLSSILWATVGPTAGPKPIGTPSQSSLIIFKFALPQTISMNRSTPPLA